MYFHPSDGFRSFGRFIGRAVFWLIVIASVGWAGTTAARGAAPTVIAWWQDVRKSMASFPAPPVAAVEAPRVTAPTIPQQAPAPTVIYRDIPVDRTPIWVQPQNQFQPAPRREVDSSRSRAQRDADNTAAARERAFNEERQKTAIKEKEERERIARAGKAQEDQKLPPKKESTPAKSPPPKTAPQKPTPRPAAPTPSRPPVQKPKAPPQQERPRNR